MSRILLLALLLFALSARAAGADDGGGDVRVAGGCGRGASSSLRLQAHDSRIEVRFRVRETRGRGLWRVAIVHENRVAFRASRRTTRSEDSYEVRRLLPDLAGSDTVVAHAWGPRGLSCRVAATLAG